jgi:hypothetical protein
MTTATLHDLETACPGASAEFLAEQLGRQASTTEAMTAYCQFLHSEVQQKDRQIAATQARIDALEQERLKLLSKGGHTATPERLRSPGGGGSARAEAESLAADLMTESKLSRPEAMARVMRENPELRQRMVAEANAGRGFTNG